MRLHAVALITSYRVFRIVRTRAWPAAGVWLHGEAVSAGMVMAADMSRRLGWIDEGIAQRATALLQRAKLPIAPPKVPSPPSAAPVPPWQCCHEVLSLCMVQDGSSHPRLCRR